MTVTVKERIKFRRERWLRRAESDGLMKEEEQEEQEEAVCISVVNTNEDPPNAHQAQHRPVQATGAMSA